MKTSVVIGSGEGFQQEPTGAAGMLYTVRGQTDAAGAWSGSAVFDFPGGAFFSGAGAFEASQDASGAISYSAQGAYSPDRNDSVAASATATFTPGAPATADAPGQPSKINLTVSDVSNAGKPKQIVTGDYLLVGGHGVTFRTV